MVVLISGSGSNLQSLIDQQAEHGVNIAAVWSNKESAYGLKRARHAGIANGFLDPKSFADRREYDAALRDLIEKDQPDLVVLAGFMRILSDEFVNHFQGRLLNIHPSLLPKYPGLDTHARVLASGDALHGCSVHFVIPQLDAGPTIVQAQVPVLSDDTATSLQARVQQQEHRIYALAVQWFAQDRLHMQDQQAWLDGQPLPATGVVIDA